MFKRNSRFDAMFGIKPKPEQAPTPQPKPVITQRPNPVIGIIGSLFDCFFGGPPKQAPINYLVNKQCFNCGMEIPQVASTCPYCRKDPYTLQQ